MPQTFIWHQLVPEALLGAGNVESTYTHPCHFVSPSLVLETDTKQIFVVLCGQLNNQNKPRFRSDAENEGNTLPLRRALVRARLGGQGCSDLSTLDAC